MTTHQDDEEIKDGLKDEWWNGCRLGHGSPFFSILIQGRLR